MSKLPASPIEVADPVVRTAAKQAVVWLGLAAAMWLAWQLADALLLIVGALVFAALLDGGTRLLGRVVPAGRGVRLTLVVLLMLAAVAGFLAVTGYQIAAQWEMLRATLTQQLGRLSAILADYGVTDLTGRDGQGLMSGLATELFGSVGKLTEFVGGAIGAIGSLILIVVLGTFIAAEPRLYERGIEWLTPRAYRASAAGLMEKLASTLRRWTAGRLFAMACDGGLTALGLWIVGVPLAPLLGLIAFALAFIPNIGAAISGVLMVLVGFSVDANTGLLAIAVYVIVQFVEGNILTPLVEKRAVDLAPAVVLAAQLLFGALFGLLGLALADPIVAMIKVALEHRRAAKPPQSDPTQSEWPTSTDSEPSAHPS